MNKTLSNSVDLLALVLYAASVFMIADGESPLGIVFLTAGSCFMCLASMVRRKETQKKTGKEPLDRYEYKPENLR